MEREMVMSYIEVLKKSVRNKKAWLVDLDTFGQHAMWFNVKNEIEVLEAIITDLSNMVDKWGRI